MDVNPGMEHLGGGLLELPGMRTAGPEGLRVEQAVPLDGNDAARVAVRELVRRPHLLRVVVQPFINVERGSVAGYECLTRCPPQWGVGPQELFRAASELEVSAALQGLVLEQVLELRDTAAPNTFLTVNLEPMDLLDDVLVGILLDAADLSRIMIEVTERDWPQDTAPMVDALDRLRSIGALVALDDAGAGHSDLARLMALRPDLVKLDRDIIEDVDTSARTRSMISLMGDLCGRLDAWLLVEGVERIEQLRAVAQLGVPLVQGRLLAPPAAPWPVVELAQEHQVVLQEAAQRDTVVSLVQPPQDATQLGGRPRSGQMSMAPQTRLSDALRRALNRPAPTRFDPVMVTDSRGLILGEIPLDRLMLAVVDRSDQGTGRIN